MNETDLWHPVSSPVHGLKKLADIFPKPEIQT